MHVVLLVKYVLFSIPGPCSQETQGGAFSMQPYLYDDRRAGT